MIILENLAGFDCKCSQNILITFQLNHKGDRTLQVAISLYWCGPPQEAIGPNLKIKLVIKNQNQVDLESPGQIFLDPLRSCLCPSI